MTNSGPWIIVQSGARSEKLDQIDEFVVGFRRDVTVLAAGLQRKERAYCWTATEKPFHMNHHHHHHLYTLSPHSASCLAVAFSLFFHYYSQSPLH